MGFCSAERDETVHQCYGCYFLIMFGFACRVYYFSLAMSFGLELSQYQIQELEDRFSPHFVLKYKSSIRSITEKFVVEWTPDLVFTCIYSSQELV